MRSEVMLEADNLSSQQRLQQAWHAASLVTDPEIPVLTLDDLGIIRDITLATDGEIELTITPTYSGCPAMAVIELDLQTAMAEAGFPSARIATVLKPAWTTDWMSAEGREKLRAYGIAPPVASASRRSLFGEDDIIACPQCGSQKTVKISEFGSTACKSLWRCNSCLEPFDAFKCI